MTREDLPTFRDLAGLAALVALLAAAAPWAEPVSRALVALTR